MLKSLVRCGGCGSRYVGDKCHGRYYYRCHKRCKQVPSITEKILDDTVKEAVSRALLNPELVVENYKSLLKSNKEDRQSRQATRQVAEVELRQIPAEEERVLEAYRIGIISPDQLATQLEHLRARKATLQDDCNPNSEPNSSAEVSVDLMKALQEMQQRVTTFSPEQWAQFLRGLLVHVVFKGSSVEILGRVELGNVVTGKSTLEVPLTPRMSTSSLSLHGKDRRIKAASPRP